MSALTIVLFVIAITLSVYLAAIYFDGYMERRRARKRNPKRW